MAEQVTRSIIVSAPIDHVYALWADFTQFPQFMENIDSVTTSVDGLSHWVMNGPFNQKLSWDARTTRLEPHTRIAWNSLDGGDIKTSGQVTFTELPLEQTEVSLTLQYVPPLGKLGEVLAHMFDNPENKLDADLARFKHYAETKQPK